MAVCWVRTSTWIDVPVLVWYSHMLHVLIPVPKAKSRYLDGWTWTKCLKNTGNLYTGIHAKKFLRYSSDQWKRKGCRSRFWDGDCGVLQSFEVEMRKYQHPWRGQTHLSYVNQHCDFGTALELFESLIFGSGKFTCGNELDALSERGLGKFERDGIMNKITENRKGWQRGNVKRVGRWAWRIGERASCKWPNESALENRTQNDYLMCRALQLVINVFICSDQNMTMDPSTCIGLWNRV